MNEPIKIEVVKVEGEFVWHSHPETEDFFLVLEGELEIELCDRTVRLRKGDLFVAPRGVEHRPPRREGGARPPDRAARHGEHRRRGDSELTATERMI